MRSWTTWDEPDRQVAVARWEERDVSVVFPLHWAALQGQRAMIARAKERILEVEQKAGGKTLAPGSVLLAFSAHEEQAPDHTIDPGVPRNLQPVAGA